MTKFAYLEPLKVRHIHFVGIGGISMSGLAEILLHQGYTISGSDEKPSGITQRLEKMGVKVYSHHSKDNIDNPDLVVYTAAVKENNPERMRAKELNIPSIERAVLLGEIMKKFPFSVAVSGTHGKTTTTSMITMIMIEAGLDPTVHIGGELEAIGGNTKIGGNRYFIAEACEYVESFLKFYPFMAIILNIEADHLDYFRDIGHIKEAFLKFTTLIPENGCVIACMDDPNIRSIFDIIKGNKITYGLKAEDATWSAENISYDESGYASFTALKDKKVFAAIELSVQGEHNVSNALAAIAACHVLGCNITSIKEGLRKFTGTRKRFEYKGMADGIRVIDDYAHHPTEIKATLKAAKNLNPPKIWCVFQPHTYTRTKLLLDEFASAFSDADTVIISDIYAAREADTGEIHSRVLAGRACLKGQNALYIHGFELIAEYLMKNASAGDMIITMGAGDICKVGEIFLENKKTKTVC